MSKCSNLLARLDECSKSKVSPLHAFGFRICFGKTFIAFDIDEKLAQSVAQVTM